MFLSDLDSLNPEKAGALFLFASTLPDADADGRLEPIRHALLTRELNLYSSKLHEAFELKPLSAFDDLGVAPAYSEELPVIVAPCQDLAPKLPSRKDAPVQTRLSPPTSPNASPGSRRPSLPGKRSSSSRPANSAWRSSTFKPPSVPYAILPW